MYKGALAKQIAQFMDKEGGLVTAEDLAKHRSTWEKPISSTYLGNPVVAFPPNTQGVTLLEALNVAELSDLKPMGRNSADYIHAIVEGAKLAYADRDKYVADPAFVQVPVDRLISKDYAADLARRLRDKLKANDGSANANRDGTGDTVFLGVVDKDGNAVSMIQSLFAAFGSGRDGPRHWRDVAQSGLALRVGHDACASHRAREAAVPHAVSGSRAASGRVADDGGGHAGW